MATVSQIKIDTNVYDIKDQAAMPKSGGVFTGDIGITNDTPILYFNDDSLDITEFPSSEVKRYPIRFRDKNGKYFGRLGSYFTNLGEHAISMYAMHEVDGGSANYNGITFYVDAHGNKKTSINGGPAFREALVEDIHYWPLSLGGTGGSDLGWHDFTNNSVFTDGPIVWRKIGPWVEIRGAFLKLKSDLTNPNNHVTLGTLPEEIRPHSSMNKYRVYLSAGSSAYPSARGAAILIYSSGEISFYKPSELTTYTSSMTFSFQGMYLV